MSLLSQLAPQEGATHYKKRLGRGRGSGLGQTSAKGHKGQLARSGGRVRRGFEGGQSPLSRRLPKYGFNNPFAIEYDIVNLAQLNRFTGTVDAATLKKAGVIHGETFKVLGRGKIEKALTVKANKFSETAQKAIEAAGGKIEVVK